VFLQGFSAAGALVAALLFLRFWRESGDRLFAFFSAAFGLMAVSWGLLGLFSPTEETRPYIYAVRLAAFLLLIIAVVDKNRDAS
jgi:hypothetical protein